MSSSNTTTSFYITKKKILLVFLLFSSAPFFWHANISNYSFFGGADYIAPLNLSHQFFNRLFTYDVSLYSGISNISATANLFPFYVFFLFFRLFNLTPFLISLLFISCIIFISQFSFFCFIEYVFKNKINPVFKDTIVFSFFGAVLYGFSPHIVALLSPGHCLMLISYAFFPLILKYFDIFLVSKKFDLKILVYLFFLSLICASNFANIAGLAALLLILFIYTLLLIAFKFISITKAVLRGGSVMAAILISNLWWFLPFILNIQKTIALNRTSATIITENLNIEVQCADIINIFLGRASGSFYSNPLLKYYYLGFPMLIIYLAIFSFFLIAVSQIKKNRYLLVLFLLSLITIFLVKGSRAPFAGVFMWLYNNVLAFQMFRRPVSKFYWSFLFSYISLAIIGIAILADEIKKQKKIKVSLSFFVPILIVSIYLVYIFAKTPALHMTPFNIPDFFYQANDYLLKDGVQRVLIIPSFLYLKAYYDESVDFYQGIDFLNFIWEFPKTTVAFSDYPAQRLYQKPTKQLIQLIRENKSICELAKNLGLSHIMVRQNIPIDVPIQDQPDVLIEILDKHTDIKEKKVFDEPGINGFSVYKLKDKCSGSLFMIAQGKNSRAEVIYKVINPVKKIIKISQLREGIEFQYLVNFNSNWNLYLKPGPKNNDFMMSEYEQGRKFFEGEELTYLWKKPIFKDTHKIVHEYANAWIIDPEYIKQNFSKEYYKENPDGSIDIELILYFKPQSYFYLGLLVSGFVLLLCASYLSKGLIHFKRSKFLKG